MRWAMLPRRRRRRRSARDIRLAVLHRDRCEQGKSLPNDYASFGSVTSGMDVVKKIEALTRRRGRSDPTTKATIDKITITES